MVQSDSVIFKLVSTVCVLGRVILYSLAAAWSDQLN